TVKQPRARKASICPPVSTIPPSSNLREARERWTAIKLAIGDSQNFLDLVSGINWRDGLTVEAMNLIKAHLCTGEGGEGGGGVRKEIGRTGLQTHGLVTLSAARHADEVLGIIFRFAVGMLRYTGLFQSHLLAHEKLNRARQRSSDLDQQLRGSVATCPTRGGRQMTGVELRERVEETELGEASLRRLEEELRDLQEEFNAAAVKKHSLGQTCSQLAESLKSASHLLDSLKYRQEAWQYRLDHTPSEHLLATNCLLAAAITTYTGPYPILSRIKMVSALTGVCLETKMVAEEETNQLLKIEEYPLFMMGQTGLYQLELEGLPPDLTSRVSACVISRGHTHSPPLISDPFNMAAPWISRHYQGSRLVDFESPGLQSSLTEAMKTGSTLAVTGVEGQRLSSNALLSYLLKCPQDTSSRPSKIKIEKKEVEIHPHFKLVLVTTSLSRELPSELVAATTVVVFWPEVGGVRDLLLDRFLWQQNSKTAQEREHLRHEVHSQSGKIEETERELLALLSSDLCVHSDHQTTRDLLLLNTSHNNSKDSLAGALDSLDRMTRVQLSSLSSLASRAALISSVVMATGISLPLYTVSYDYVESVFLSFLEQMGSHVQGAESVVEKMTRFAYQHFSRGMVERDRLLLAFSLVLQLELSGGVVTHHEISYLLRPSPGREYAVKGLATQTGVDLTHSTPVSLGRRPYDWILEAQWQSLLMLASHFLWAQRALRLSMSDDAQGLQANMRHIFQSKHPELYVTMGDKRLDEKALKEGRNLIQILLLNSGIRPDRLALSIQAVSEAVLVPPRSSYDMPVELRKFHKTCSKGKTPLVIFHDDPHLPTNQIRALARKLHVPLRVVCVHGTGETEVEAVREALAVTSSQGGWLLLHNIQESEDVVSELTSLLRTYPPSDGWRVWLSVHAGSVTSLPVSLLHGVCRVVLDTPSSLKGSLLYTLASMPPDLFSASTRVEWLPLLHSSALLFPLLRTRREMHTISWRYCPPLPHTLLTDFLRYLKTVVQVQNETTSTGGYAPLSWSGLRHMLSEVFFGSLVCDPVDLRTLTSWLKRGSILEVLAGNLSCITFRSCSSLPGHALPSSARRWSRPCPLSS
ncbi:Dynein heavy chain 8, axonemal, partial [Geodia barretti]